MISFYDGLFGLVLLTMMVITLIIDHHHKTMGTIHKAIIENNILVLVLAILSNVVILFTMHDSLDVIHIIIYITLLIHITIISVRYKNNIREKGLIINFKKIYWENIKTLKKTDYSTTVVYNKKGKEKTIDIMHMNFKSSFLQKKLKDYSIEVE